MTRSLTIATTAVENPMGAQAYEQAIIREAPAAFAREDEVWQVRNLVSRSIRSSLPGQRRLPMGWLYRASPAARRALGRFIYPRSSVVHRMDLILPPPPGPDVVTLHDVVAWIFDDESAPVRASVDELNHADAVICVSQFTSDQAQEKLGISNTVVVPNGVDPRYFDAAPLDEAALEALGLRAPYLLYAGGSARRKNLPGLAEAWRRVADARPDWTLALAGPTSAGRTSLFAGLPRVRHLGRLPDHRMPGLTRAAGAVVVPSLYEGFGLPALEAMASRTPLLASARASIPEVVGNAGILVEPSPEALAEGIESITSGHPSISRLVADGFKRAQNFTWSRTADGHAQIWRRFAL